MVEKGLRAGQVVEVECTRMSVQGAAVATLSHNEVYVSGALPGARVRVQIDHVSPHKTRGLAQAWGHVTEVVQQSADARPTFCPAFGTCGGCIWQHLAYERQLAWKRQLVNEALAAHRVDCAAMPCVASPQDQGYRNQGKYVVHTHGNTLRLGGYAPRTHDVVDLTECHLVEPAVATSVMAVKRLIEPLKQHLRHVVVRANQRGQALVTLIFGKPAAARAASAPSWAQRLMDLQPTIVGVVANVNDQPGDVIFGDEEFVLHGQGFIDDEIAGARVRLSPRAFFQVNRHVAALAYLEIAAFARDLGGVRAVWDIYAGVGTIAKVLRHELPELQSAFCVEVRRAAVADAQAVQRQAAGGLTFVAGTAESVLQTTAAPTDLIVLNPPRAGCDQQVLERVAAASPRGLAYLSCNPATLSRDLALLASRGLRATAIKPFDMLPHTPHVETLALLLPA